MNDSECEPLLAVIGLSKHFVLRSGALRQKQKVRAVDGVNFIIRGAETLGLVGESGCGKSTLANLLLRLIEVTEGQILFEGKPIEHASGSDLSIYRRNVQAIFQDPFSSLNPRMRVGDIVAEPLIVAGLLSRSNQKQKVAELFTQIGLNPAWQERYPHELSGGQRQRIAIARGISLNPKLLILDEPVSALDVSVRSQILNLLRELQLQLGVTYLLISHDLPIVSRLCTRIAVMYLGRVVEIGPAKQIAANPRHPYTRALFSAVLPSHPRAPRTQIALTSDIPSPINVPSGCRFRTRCFAASQICEVLDPPIFDVASDHHVACHFAQN